MKTCLNEQTVDKIVSFEDVISDPMSLFVPFNLTKDMALFSSSTEIFENMVACNF